MKKILACCIILIALVAISCTHYVAPVAPIVSPDIESINAHDIPIYNGAVIAPSYLEFKNVGLGDTIDTWVESQYSDIKGHVVSYQAGDPLCVIVFNPFNEVRSYGINYLDAANEINICQSLNNDIKYSKAPSGFYQYVTLSSSSVTVNPRSIKKIPFSVFIANELKYPKNWEFRINIIDEKIIGNLNIGGTVRIFISMR